MAQPEPVFTDPKPAGGKDDKSRDEGAKKTREDIEDKGREEYFTLRRWWSWYLMLALGGSILFQGCLIWRVGDGLLPFTDNKVFVNTVAGELFLQIAGMCLIVVRFLFPAEEKKGKDKAKSSGKAKQSILDESGGLERGKDR